MRARKKALLSTTVLSLAIGLGAVLSSCTNEGDTNTAQVQGGNPCAAANPCNPCAAANPCNPCAAAKQVAQASPSAGDLNKLYADLQGALKAGYSKSGSGFASEYQSWAIFNSQPYVSQTHGKRYVNNYANDGAKAAYAKFETIGKMPSGGVLAKDSFVVKDGKAQPGPLFLMEKMDAGFNPASDDWRYTLIMPDGTVFGTTNGEGSKKVEFCVQCHKAVADQDSLYFLDEKYRTAQ